MTFFQIKQNAADTTSLAMQEPTLTLAAVPEDSADIIQEAPLATTLTSEIFSEAFSVGLAAEDLAVTAMPLEEARTLK